jgi:hypothetical protein
LTRWPAEQVHEREITGPECSLAAALLDDAAAARQHIDLADVRVRAADVCRRALPAAVLAGGQLADPQRADLARHEPVWDALRLERSDRLAEDVTPALLTGNGGLVACPKNDAHRSRP